MRTCERLDYACISFFPPSISSPSNEGNSTIRKIFLFPSLGGGYVYMHSLMMMAVNSYSHRSRRLLFHAIVKNAAKYRKDLYPGHDRHRNISQIPCIPLRPTPIEFACPLATYSRDYQRINPLDQRFPFPGQRGLNRVLFLLSNSIETRFAFLATEYPEKISFARFPFVCKCEQSGIHMYIRIDTTVKRSVVQL